MTWRDSKFCMVMHMSLVRISGSACSSYFTSEKSGERYIFYYFY